MTLFKFTKPFEWWGPPRGCVFCRLALWVFKKSDEPVEIPDDAASAALRAGAGSIVAPTGSEGGDQ